MLIYYFQYLFMIFVYFILICGIYLFMIMIQYGNYRKNLLRFSFLSEIMLGKKKRHEVGSGYKGELGADLGGVNGECD